MSGPGDGEEIRGGRTRAPTRTINWAAAAGLISSNGPCEGGRVILALLAANETGHEKTTFPDGRVDTEPEPTSYAAALSSKYSDAWVDAMRSELDGVEAAGIFVEVSELPPDSNVVQSKWLLK